MECVYERGLRLVNKGTTTDRAKQCARALHKDGLAAAAMMSFIIGLPWEDESDCMTTLRFAAELRRDIGVTTNTSWWVPIPSRLWNRRAEFGIRLPDDIYNTAGWVRDEQIHRAYRLRIDDAARRRIEGRIAAYEALGLPLRRRSRATIDDDNGL